MTDIEYLYVLVTDDNNGIRRMYDGFRGKFFQYFRNHYNINEDDIADAYQDAIILTWKNVKRGKLTPQTLNCELLTYLIGVGKNIISVLNRHYSRELIQEDQVWGQISDNIPSDEIDIEKELLIKNTVENMNEPCKSILTKFYWEEMSFEEIALDMNYANADTAKAQKYRCMQKIKSVLERRLS